MIYQMKETNIKLILYLAVASALLLISVNPVVAQNSTDPFWRKSASSLTIFQPGDAIRIQVWELYEQETNLNLTGDYPISPEGTIIVPLVGEMKVKGMTVFELMQALENKLRAYMRNPLVYVRPLIRLTLQGAFIQPGAFRVPPTSSLWDVIALAGGPRGDCDLEKLRVERGGEEIMSDLLESFESGYSLEDIGIESGDQILAPSRRGITMGTIIGFLNLIMTTVLLYLRIRYRTWY